MVHQCLSIALHVALSLFERKTSNVPQPFLVILLSVWKQYVNFITFCTIFSTRCNTRLKKLLSINFGLNMFLKIALYKFPFIYFIFFY